MTITELLNILRTLEVEVPITIGTVEGQYEIAVDRHLAVVAWYSAPSVWAEEEISSITLVSLQDVDRYLADAGNARRVA